QIAAMLLNGRPMLVHARDQLGGGEDGVAAQPARYGAGMAGLAEALNGAVADIAANAGDDGDRPAAVDQYRSLLDMGLEEEPDPARIDERFACRHQVDRDAD